MTSYVVTVGFYIIMNLIPDMIKEVEDGEHSLPYKCSMHRDIQLFLNDILFMWGSVIKFAVKKSENINTQKIDTISKMFDKEIIIESAANVKIFESSNAIDINSKPITWANNIKGDLAKIDARGKKIFEHYAKDIPTEVYYSMKYLLEESVIVGLMIHTFYVFVQGCDKECVLANCIATDVSNNLNLNKTADNIEAIYKWINNEYDQLMNKLDKDHKTGIYKINYETYLK